MAHSQFCVLLVLCCWFSLRLRHISFPSKYEILVWSETVPISFSFNLIINLDFMSWNLLQCSRECCCLVFWPNGLSLPLCLSLWLTLWLWESLGLSLAWCDRFHHVIEGDRFPMYQMTQVPTSASCPLWHTPKKHTHIESNLPSCSVLWSSLSPHSCQASQVAALSLKIDAMTINIQHANHWASCQSSDRCIGLQSSWLIRRD